MENTDRIYTTINQAGTVSGRVTSDFQQFPRSPIKSKTGEELFYPRKMIKITGNGYNKIVYIDYSQIELRFQAMYTILVGHPDLNLCRAYMPYKCYRLVDNQKEEFDYNNLEHIMNWDSGEWLHLEDDTHWEPVDVHGATATAATGLKPGDAGFKEARSNIGKRTNFARLSIV